MATGLYSLIPEERLRDILSTLHEFLQLPVQLLDADGRDLLRFGEAPGYCTRLKKTLLRGGECARLHAKAGLRAMEIGEAYIFSCHADLNHIAFPLLDHSLLLGCIIIGPFLMDAPDSTIVSALSGPYELDSRLALELYDELGTLRVLPPRQVNLLKKLLEYMLSPLMPGAHRYLRQTQEKLYQQSRISESIQSYKTYRAEPAQSFLREKESELLTEVRTGSVERAKALLNEVIGQTLSVDGGRADAVRLRAIELSTLLSRVAMDGGADTESVYALNSKFVTLMNSRQDLDELCFLLQDMVEGFMDAMFSQTDRGNLYVRRTLQYIAANYSGRATLEAAAKAAGLSPNYLSSLFKQITGVSFREQLCRVRVEQSKRLLLSTDYSLDDIAAAVGFSDQSYYCRVFKRIVGLTPGQYRN